MEPDPAHLAALVAITELGSFDAAARALHITPSAVSQRIRALEAAVGHVVVVRASPCRPTEAGEALVRLGRQIRLLMAEAGHELEARGVLDLPVAVNADSLATWFRPLLAEVAQWPGTALRLHVEDQAWSSELLRSGDVLAAVTSDPVPVQGCTAEPLGVLRYLPVATPRIAAVAWVDRPMVVFNEKDHLQHDFLAQLNPGPTTEAGARTPAVVHRVPTSTEFAEAVRVGLGWALLPEPQAASGLASGELVRLGKGYVDVPLWWQRWRLDSAALTRLGERVRTAALAGLRSPT